MFRYSADSYSFSSRVSMKQVFSITASDRVTSRFKSQRLFLILFIFIFIAIFSVVRVSSGFAESDLKSDEELLFFPTIASFDPDQRIWLVDVQAWVFETEKDSKTRKIFIQGFRGWLKFSEDEIDNNLLMLRTARFILIDKL